jgi:DNA-binding NarL/FixJ family response regulator
MVSPSASTAAAATPAASTSGWPPIWLALMTILMAPLCGWMTAGHRRGRTTSGGKAVRSAAMTRIRVALAEDHVLLREGISRLVAANDDMELVGTAGDLPALLDLMERERPDVVVTDIRMPPTGTDEGIQAAAWARQHQPGAGVVVLSQYVAPGYAVALLEHGSAGRAYLLKERIGNVAELAAAIRAVAGGGSVIDPMVVDELVRSRTHDSRPGLSSLTPRELEILAEMAQGKSNSAIAAALFVTERAVEKHTNSIFAKLGLSEERDVNRRVKAVLVYLSQHQNAD